MTVTQLAIQSFLSPHTDRGVSEDATRLRERISDLFTDLVQSVTLGASYREASSALEEAYQEHSAENWDGYGAKAISPASYTLASRFLAKIVFPNFPQFSEEVHLQRIPFHTLHFYQKAQHSSDRRELPH